MTAQRDENMRSLSLMKMQKMQMDKEELETESREEEANAKPALVKIKPICLEEGIPIFPHHTIAWADCQEYGIKGMSCERCNNK